MTTFATGITGIVLRYGQLYGPSTYMEAVAHGHNVYKAEAGRMCRPGVPRSLLETRVGAPLVWHRHK